MQPVWLFIKKLVAKTNKKYLYWIKKIILGQILSEAFPDAFEDFTVNVDIRNYHDQFSSWERSLSKANIYIFKSQFIV